MKAKKTSFYLYRYQILPQNRHFQGELFDDVKSPEDLIARKNLFFAEALEAIHGFQAGQTEINTKRLHASNDFYLYRIAANRSLHREKKDFTEEELDNWPSILVAIWNHPDKQLIAVQKRIAAFQNANTVVRFILESIADKLSNRYLNVFFEPLFEEKVFWDLAEKNEGKINLVEFEFITPNMANISGSLNEDLKAFAKATNSSKNKVAIEASPNSALDLDQSNENLSGLVEYSSQGGGDISVRIHGIKKRIHTSRTVKEVEISELELQGTTEGIVNVLKTILP